MEQATFRTPVFFAPRRHVAAGLIAALAGVSLMVIATQSAFAVGTAVPLGTAGAYTALAGTTVTNDGPSFLPGNVGVSPGSAVTGFPPGIAGGETHAGDAEALQAQADLAVAYDDAADQPSDGDIGGDLGGETLLPGVYTASSAALLTGPLVLDGQGNPAAVFVFQIGSMLTTATGSSVELVNGTQACNVFWQVGSSAVIGEGTRFVGTILALTSISLGTGTTVEGRALARNGAVTLNSNVFSTPGCATPTEPPTDTPTETPSVPPPTDTPTVPPTDTPTSTPTDTPTVPPTDTPTSTPTDTPSAPVVTPGPTPSASGPSPDSPSPANSGGAGSPGPGPGDRSTVPGGPLPATGMPIPAPLAVSAALALLAGTGMILSGIRRARGSAL